MKSEKQPVKIQFDSSIIPDDELQKVSGGDSGGGWVRYWCDACNCPHILDYPNNRCPITNNILYPWG